jgi:hypothetical protein
MIAWWRRRSRATHCRCGCPRDFHAHYTAATYCGRCGSQRCRKFRPEWQVDAALRLANSGHEPPGPAYRPGPAPGHHNHGGITQRLVFFRCGCVHCYGPGGALAEVIPCTGDDIDREWRLLDGQH